MYIKSFQGWIWNRYGCKCVILVDMTSVKHHDLICGRSVCECVNILHWKYISSHRIDNLILIDGIWPWLTLFRYTTKSLQSIMHISKDNTRCSKDHNLPSCLHFHTYFNSTSLIIGLSFLILHHLLSYSSKYIFRTFATATSTLIYVYDKRLS